LPHIKDTTERAAIAACFLGQATWDQPCVETSVDNRSLPRGDRHHARGLL